MKRSILAILRDVAHCEHMAAWWQDALVCASTSDERRRAQRHLHYWNVRWASALDELVA